MGFLGIHTLVLEGEKIKKQTKEIVVKENETYFVKFTLNEEINELKEIIIKIKESKYNCLEMATLTSVLLGI